MSNEADARAKPRAVGQRRKRSKVLPPGYSWLSVPIPTETADHLHIQARSSGMPFQEYMARFCLEAFPYSREDSGTATIPETATEAPPLTKAAGRPKLRASCRFA